MAKNSQQWHPSLYSNRVPLLENRKWKNICFCEDNWCSILPLKNWKMDNINVDWHLKIVDVIKEGEWNLDILKRLLSTNCIQDIISVPISLDQSVEDKIIWKFSAKETSQSNQRMLGWWTKITRNWNGIWNWVSSQWSSFFVGF